MAKKVKISITLPEDVVERLENYRKAQPTIPSRSEAVARLLDKALKAEGFSLNQGQCLAPKYAEGEYGGDRVSA